jgi:diadenosine tetraphosphate (Ap4A) HIT family hydrolase
MAVLYRTGKSGAHLGWAKYRGLMGATPENSCFVCDKHAQGDAVEGGVIWSDGLVYAGHCHLLGARDIALGWLIVEPKRYVAGLGDLTEDEAGAVGILVSRLAKALVEVEGAEHVYSFVFGDGLAADHLHVHVMPRYPRTPGEFWQKRVVEWPDGPRGDAEATGALSLRIADYLAQSSTSPETGTD